MSYLFFYENYNIYKTEQLCANLYRLMEMIFISRQLKATLVLPNFYFTPRNNQLINKTDELYIDRIEFIDISNILNLEKLKEVCNFITVSEYFKIINTKSLNTILISKPNEDIPFNNNKYHTIYGTIKTTKHIEINYSSIYLLNYSDKFKEAENIIIHNFNRMGNPLWYKNASSEYYKIRESIKFNDSHYAKSNTYKGIDYENTLLIHWRRGDFKLTNLADEEETKEYYKHYNNLNSLENISKNILLICFENKITSVFLLTNESNEEELKKLSYILSEFNINLIMYGSSNDNNSLKYITNDICGIIIGSRCKYQLYTGSYDRMSQYGRWIQEEYFEKKTIFWMID
jgi:hypothetical protein